MLNEQNDFEDNKIYSKIGNLIKIVVINTL